ncbi:PIN domain-containing protein [Microbacterium marinilacus]|uniref:Ribonuclease VapC n=1 Tax=Microbacterium marinilacus TaxID=415209 RepID=A0ABP7BXA6_9MICO|nr:PIN domain-containing protein [Microbacterium marinilacus]MBY0688180.1 PIN domain-containing protein [Microbacterium marinilacus]
MPTSAELLLDTSAAVALVQPTHVHHRDVLDHVRGRALGLAGHAAIETYSVLTRLPGAQRVSAAVAARMIEVNFPRSHALSAAGGRRAPSRFAAAGIAGGAVYDGLVALAAEEARIALLTCDRRAVDTYARLGVDVTIV